MYTCHFDVVNFFTHRDEQIEVVNYLITEQGVDVNSTDDEGWTALHYACR